MSPANGGENTAIHSLLQNEGGGALVFPSVGGKRGGLVGRWGLGWRKLRRGGGQ